MTYLPFRGSPVRKGENALYGLPSVIGSRPKAILRRHERFDRVDVSRYIDANIEQARYRASLIIGQFGFARLGHAG